MSLHHLKKPLGNEILYNLSLAHSQCILDQVRGGVPSSLCKYLCLKSATSNCAMLTTLSWRWFLDTSLLPKQSMRDLGMG